jgi:hypothetical protein
VLPPNSIIIDNLFGEFWTVIGSELRHEGVRFYQIRNEAGDELSIAEWALEHFEVVVGG